MPEKFTFFEKFGEAMAALNDNDRRELAYAIVMYGAFGEQVDVSYVPAAVLAALKDDIDNSKQAQKSGSKGGRPSKKRGVSETEKPPVSENGKPGVSKKTGKTESQTKPIQANKKDTPDGVSKKTPPRHRHGRYSNVLLSDDDLATLKAEFPADWPERIERLSEYIASTGKAYRNHLATIRSWERRDRQEAERKGGGEHEQSEYSAL